MWRSRIFERLLFYFHFCIKKKCIVIYVILAAGIGDIRNENDANCTYEGENSILIQQTSNWLLSLWKKIQEGNKIETPYDSATFLNDHKSILSSNSQKIKLQNDITLPGNANFVMDLFDKINFIV